MPDEESVARMQAYSEHRDHARQIRANALQLNDLVTDMRWIAAGGRGAVDPTKLQELAEATARMAEDLAEMDVPNPYELRDEAGDTGSSSTEITPTDIKPTDCLLCDFAGETVEAYEQHMDEVHDL